MEQLRASYTIDIEEAERSLILAAVHALWAAKIKERDARSVEYNQSKKNGRQPLHVIADELNQLENTVNNLKNLFESLEALGKPQRV